MMEHLCCPYGLMCEESGPNIVRTSRLKQRRIVALLAAQTYTPSIPCRSLLADSATKASSAFEFMVSRAWRSAGRTASMDFQTAPSTDIEAPSKDESGATYPHCKIVDVLDTKLLCLLPLNF